MSYTKKQGTKNKEEGVKDQVNTKEQEKAKNTTVLMEWVPKCRAGLFLPAAGLPVATGCNSD